MSRRRLVILAVAVTVAGLGAALILLTTPRADQGLSLTIPVGAVLLAAGCASFGYAFGRRTRRGVIRMADQIDRMVADGEVGEVECPESVGEMRRLADAVNHLLDWARQTTEQRTLAVRQEQIRNRILHADKRHMEAVLNSIADAVVVTNAFGDITMANGAAEKTLGFSFDADRRVPIADVVQDPGLLAVVDQLRRSEHHIPRKVVESEIGSNGESRVYKATVNAVRSDGGQGEELSGLVSVLHDITKEREAAKMKSEFVSKVAHELRTPLSSIRAYVEMLVDGEAEDEETRGEFVQIIDSESDRLARMIDNMLNISRIEAGVIKVQKADLALTGIVKEAVECLKPQADAKQIALEGELPPVFYQVHSDRDMIYQAVLNVISNALKYTPEGGSVTVSSGVESGLAQVRVADTGMGIPADDLPRLFDKFYRVGANKKAAKGTGLGLALVKEIVETLHHGQLRVESEVGKGTTFILEFPVVE